MNDAKGSDRPDFITTLRSYWYIDGDDWEWKVLDCKRVGNAGSIPQLLSITRKRLKIDQNYRYFLDAAQSIGQWRIDWRWLIAGLPGNAPFYDLRDPFSDLLVRYCTRELPQRSGLLLGKLIRNAHSYSSYEIQTLQEEIVDALRDDGIVPKDIVFKARKGKDLKAHQCPYKRKLSLSSE